MSLDGPAGTPEISEARRMPRGAGCRSCRIRSGPNAITDSALRRLGYVTRPLLYPIFVQGFSTAPVHPSSSPSLLFENRSLERCCALGLVILCGLILQPFSSYFVNMTIDPEPKTAGKERPDENRAPDVKPAPDIKPAPDVKSVPDVNPAPTGSNAEPADPPAPETGENQPDALVARYPDQPEDVRGHRLLPRAHPL